MTEQQKVEILLVEDDADEAELALRSLRKNNVANEIVHIEDGEEALEFIFGTGRYAHLQSGMKPRLILLDINLPKVSGIEILRQIKSNPQTQMIPVVMLTSSKEEKDIVESYKLGANSYIVKPVNFESFSKAITELRMYWLLLNQPPVIREK